MMTKKNGKLTCLLIAVLLTGNVGAIAANSDAVVLTGTVASIVELSLIDQGSYSDLTLTADGSDVNVAIVAVECNDPVGYTVTMATTNGETGGLFSSTDEALAYTVKYGAPGSEAAVDFSGGSDEVESTSARSSVNGDARNILISWTAPGIPLAADTYSDTLTLTIAAK